MDFWQFVLQTAGLLGAALALGVLLERLKQNAIVGYLLTGILVGPAGLGLVQTDEGTAGVAELGVALLLFTIGLEFSWRRLRELGSLATLGGTLQIVVTLGLAALAALVFGRPPAEAVVIGAAVALSSTAVTLRVLASRAEMDSLHGRSALGILLMQDVAVVPLLLVIGALGPGAEGWAALTGFGLNAAKGAALVGVLLILCRYGLPRLLHIASSFRNRDLPILLAVATFLSITWVSHELGLSPALGAFVAGMLLAETPFAEQIRADMVPLRAAFVTIFFASVGMLVVRPSLEQMALALALALAILVGKALIVTGLVRLFRQPRATALATGLALAQIGEFSFVLIEVAKRTNLIEAWVFDALLGASVITLLLTPYLIAAATRAGGLWEGGEIRAPSILARPSDRRVLIVGYGPAGQAVVTALSAAEVPVLVLELNPNTVAAQRTNLPIMVGDATQPEILHHAGLDLALALVVTIPDPQTARLIIRQARLIAPQVRVIARARYHIVADSLAMAGAGEVVDEEEMVGRQLGERVVNLLGVTDRAAGAV